MVATAIYSFLPWSCYPCFGTSVGFHLGSCALRKLLVEDGEQPFCDINPKDGATVRPSTSGPERCRAVAISYSIPNIRSHSRRRHDSLQHDSLQNSRPRQGACVLPQTCLGELRGWVSGSVYERGLPENLPSFSDSFVPPQAYNPRLDDQIPRLICLRSRYVKKYAGGVYCTTATFPEYHLQDSQEMGALASGRVSYSPHLSLHRPGFSCGVAPEGPS